MAIGMALIPLLACKRPPGATNGLASASSAPALPAAEPSAPELAPLTDLSKIIDEYAANEVRADGEFKGKRLATVGVIREIRKDAFGSIHVGFSDGAPRYAGRRVSCLPDSSEAAIVSSLSVGQVATFIGRIDGLVVGSVVFGDCEIRTKETGR